MAGPGLQVSVLALTDSEDNAGKSKRTLRDSECNAEFFRRLANPPGAFSDLPAVEKIPDWLKTSAPKRLGFPIANLAEKIGGTGRSAGLAAFAHQSPAR